jgi:hypothetical protein
MGQLLRSLPRVYLNKNSRTVILSDRSLVLTCGHIPDALSPNGNPGLYSKIFQPMFDIEATNGRIGATSVISSAMAVEIMERVDILHKIDAAGSVP